MRIIAGLYKARNILQVGLSTTRSTSDLVRGMVFNTLFKIEGSALDLFSGSGAYGLEALSRGANSCVFNDVNYQAYQTIKANLTLLKVEEKVYHVFNLEATHLLLKLKQTGQLFNYIFLDPPYNFTINEDDALILSEILAPAGFIIYETHVDAQITIFKDLFVYKIKTQGIKKITFFKKVIE
ncbi:MAG: 16S rRNA (guanine(966)-N(2))-methyltransferase RsmD [Acholeplasmatales bacterium]|jgi:16S rRNA (guanine966-N2)-methyltransferase|nr:16S rRNA (guanine(966)-N(2))-methyltransferase RsmD [Acholeplasmatales bacterium]